MLLFCIHMIYVTSLQHMSMYIHRIHHPCLLQLLKITIVSNVMNLECRLYFAPLIQQLATIENAG